MISHASRLLRGSLVMPIDGLSTGCDEARRDRSNPGRQRWPAASAARASLCRLSAVSDGDKLRALRMFHLAIRLRGEARAPHGRELTTYRRGPCFQWPTITVRPAGGCLSLPSPGAGTRLCFRASEPPIAGECGGWVGGASSSCRAAFGCSGNGVQGHGARRLTAIDAQTTSRKRTNSDSTTAAPELMDVEPQSASSGSGHRRSSRSPSINR